MKVHQAANGREMQAHRTQKMVALRGDTDLPVAEECLLIKEIFIDRHLEMLEEAQIILKYEKIAILKKNYPQMILKCVLLTQ
jgi:hypothetical protein